MEEGYHEVLIYGEWLRENGKKIFLGGARTGIGKLVDVRGSKTTRTSRERRQRGGQEGHRLLSEGHYGDCMRLGIEVTLPA